MDNTIHQINQYLVASVKFVLTTSKDNIKWIAIQYPVNSIIHLFSNRAQVGNDWLISTIFRY